MMPAPPSRVIASSTRLELSEFGAEFTRAIGRVRPTFRKMEAWQEYQEPDTRSLTAFREGRVEEAERLIREEADQELGAYRELQRKGIALNRLRLIEEPLTIYLRWEMVNYRVRSEKRYGEHVQIVRETAGIALPGPVAFDFLLFDDSFALVHDYGSDGLQRGGWLVHEPSVIADLTMLTAQWRRHATDLRHTGFGTAEYSGASVDSSAR